MKGSSAARDDAFEGLEWRNVMAMLSVLRECEYTRKEHIKKRYTERASRFEETLDFMTCLRGVQEQGGRIRASEALRVDDGTEARSWLVQRLFSCRNRYRTQILRYVREFAIADGEPTLRPSSGLRHHQSHVRNFLMEMGIVHHDSQRDCYLITPEHVGVYVLAQDSDKKRPPGAIAAGSRARESLGLAAEKAIVSYEKQRVGRAFAERVDHVALRNAAAGYDIRSITLREDGVAIPRYIEVKAVSSSSLQFHWTRNEVLTARLLAEWYFLYLLPVKSNGQFAIEELRVVACPHVAVLEDAETWAVEPDVIRCCLRQERTRELGVATDDK